MDEKDMGDIYLLTCPSGKQYIGQAVKFLVNGKKWGYLARWKAHLNEIKHKKDYCRLLNNAIRKYGADSFKLELICECTLDEINDKEEYYIEKYNTLSPNGYNLTTGGKSKCRQSKETNIKKSASLMGKNKGRIMEKRKRKNSNDNDLPKYLRTCKNGYRISNHPIGFDKTFRSTKLTMEEKLNTALMYLELFNKIHELNLNQKVCSSSTKW